MTAVSALSLLELHPGTPVIVLADSGTAAELTGSGSPLCAIARVRAVSGVPEDPRLGSRWLKTRLRELLAGDLLFLDADTVVVRPLDARLAHSRLVGAAPDYHDDAGAPILRISPWVEQLAASAGWPRPVAYYNSGVLWLPDSEAVHAFFGRWKQRWAESIRQGRREDQPAFNVAVQEVAGAFAPLSGDYNVPVPVQPRWMARARIYHFWADLHLNLARPLTLLDHLVVEYGRTGRLDSAALRRCRRRNFPWVRPRGVRMAWQVRAWEEVLRSLARWAMQRTGIRGPARPASDDEAQ